jgi:hypothetical protein
MTEIADIPLDTIVARLREIEPAIRALGVTRLAVFGAHAATRARKATSTSS